MDSTTSSRIVIFPGQNISLSCVYNFVPEISSISWKNDTDKLENGKDGVTISISGTETKLLVATAGIQRNLSSKLYKCLQIDNEILSIFFYISCEFFE